MSDLAYKEEAELLKKTMTEANKDLPEGYGLTMLMYKFSEGEFNHVHYISNTQRCGTDSLLKGLLKKWGECLVPAFMKLIKSHANLSQAEYNRNPKVNDDTDFMKVEAESMEAVSKYTGMDFYDLYEESN